MSLTMSARSVTHGTFEIERVYPTTVERVFRALSEPGQKRRWFVAAKGNNAELFEMNFRVGGTDIASFRPDDGPMAGVVFTNRTTYLDIEPGKRIVLAYTMSMGDAHISASLATFELMPAENGTRLIFTEQGAYFEQSDGPKMREDGWQKLLDSLGGALRD